ncbi:tail fiber domain-containing protein [Marinicella rhabdoformis]|uniref:tail fiber domain-containing protein n=1 Tax=Marinicella rhabdoformis TaxID=2580566 RepID=UPI0012AED3D6
MNHRKTFLAVALAATYMGSVSAKTEVLAFNNQVEFSGLNPANHYQIEIKLPNGSLKTLPFHSAETLSLAATDLDMKSLQDGQYKYQIRSLSKEKSSRNDGSANTITKPASQPDLSSGVFTIKNGQTITDQDDENRDQQILDDLIVDGSACIGQDCVNGESFGFDTLRLKENNLRIKFQDTSNSASFPSNDWQLTANDSSNGGANKFSIDDIDHGSTPFTVEAGAPSHSLYVDDGGRIGFGTSTPVVRNHLVDGNTPTVRLEQNGSQGWSPQTWDVAGNEANFFIRDVTNGSKLPFRIKPGAPNDAFFIAADGKIGLGDSTPDDSLDVESGSIVVPNGRVGIGTESPTNRLHIANPLNAGITLESQSLGISWKFVNKGNLFSVSKVGTSSSEFQVFDTGAMIVGAGGATPNFDMDASGNVVIQGALTQNSDVNTKENIQLVNTSEVLNKVMSLPISVWNYKFDDDSVKHLGPMAQDFFEQFNLGHTETKIATIDTSGVALASIKELGTQLADKEKQINSLKEENQILNDRLTAIEERLKNIK